MQKQSLSKEVLENLVVDTHYYRVPDTTVTVAAVKLVNGFILIGHSACIDSDSFSESIGRQIAFNNAFDQLWALEGYRIKSDLHRADQA